VVEQWSSSGRSSLLLELSMQQFDAIADATEMAT